MKLIWRAAAAVVLCGGMVWAQDAPVQSAAEKSVPDASAPAAMTKNDAVPVAGPDYVIGPDDGLSINVWKEADLTATLPVRPDGKISLPLLGDVQASGMTPTQLAESITEKLKKFLADPRVTVVVTAINSKRVYMVGEVARSGAMPMLPHMTVLQALSSAGISQFANTKRIYVLRAQNGKQEKLPVNYRKLVKGEAMDQNYTLQPGDTIVVP
ncbi:MAG: polysaccharide biosynthesis/export family protein [Terriglobales bacterium]